jgi:hypothetical protein
MLLNYSIEMKRGNPFQAYSVRPALPYYPNQTGIQFLKKENCRSIFSGDHRCKSPQQNTKKSNLILIKATIP